MYTPNNNNNDNTTNIGIGSRNSSISGSSNGTNGSNQDDATRRSTSGNDDGTTNERYLPQQQQNQSPSSSSLYNDTTMSSKQQPSSFLSTTPGQQYHNHKQQQQQQQSQYQRIIERQNQLKLMEAQATGNISTPMDLVDFLDSGTSSTTTKVNPIDIGVRSRETARKFLYDEDDDDDDEIVKTKNTTSSAVVAAPATTTPPQSGISARELFERRNINHNDGMNLMDHDAAVYKDDGKRSSSRWGGLLLGKAYTGTERDGILLTGEDGYWNRNVPSTKRKRTNPFTTMMANWNKNPEQRNPIIYIVLSLVMIVGMYFLLVPKSNVQDAFDGNNGAASNSTVSNPTATADSNNGNEPPPVEYDGIIDHIKGILPILHSHAESEQILRERNSKRFNTLYDVLLADGVSSPKDFLNYEGPQYMALRWISYTDPAKLSATKNTPSEIVQRYAMAVLYYDSYIEFQKHTGHQATIGNMSNPNEQTIAVPNPGWTRKDYWMSEKGICMWYGIHCETKILEDGNNHTQYNANGNVTAITLPNNHVYGSLPRELQAFDYLTTIDLSHNNLIGPFPYHMGRLFRLQNLYVDMNSLTGSIPRDIGNLEDLHELYMGNNQFNSTIPSELHRLYRLTTLSLEHNMLTGNIPDLSPCKHLQNLFLNNNQLHGFLPFELVLLTNLYQLHINNNQLTGTIAPELGNALQLTSIHMENNRIGGTIPRYVFKYMSFLKEIHLENNLFTGKIPSGLSNLVNVHTFSLHDNQLQSSIPTTIRAMTSLTQFHIYNNELTGPIPTEMGTLNNLEEFWANHNKLSGSIPAELGFCRQLKTLYLEENNLQKTVPVSLGNLQRLKTFRLYKNQISGTFPSTICSLRDESYSSLTYIAADCTSQITCTCCDKCY